MRAIVLYKSKTVCEIDSPPDVSIALPIAYPGNQATAYVGIGEVEKSVEPPKLYPVATIDSPDHLEAALLGFEPTYRQFVEELYDRAQHTSVSSINTETTIRAISTIITEVNAMLDQVTSRLHTVDALAARAVDSSSGPLPEPIRLWQESFAHRFGPGEPIPKETSDLVCVSVDTESIEEAKNKLDQIHANWQAIRAMMKNETVDSGPSEDTTSIVDAYRMVTTLHNKITKALRDRDADWAICQVLDERLRTISKLLDTPAPGPDLATSSSLTPGWLWFGGLIDVVREATALAVHLGVIEDVPTLSPTFLAAELEGELMARAKFGEKLRASVSACERIISTMISKENQRRKSVQSRSFQSLPGVYQEELQMGLPSLTVELTPFDRTLSLLHDSHVQDPLITLEPLASDQLRADIKELEAEISRLQRENALLYKKATAMP